MDLANIFGWVATLSMLMGYLPQAINTLRTRQTDGIYFPTFLMMGFSSLFFALQGLVLSNWPLMVTNTITLICCIIITGIKIQNGRKRK